MKYFRLRLSEIYELAFGTRGKQTLKYISNFSFQIPWDVIRSQSHSLSLFLAASDLDTVSRLADKLFYFIHNFMWQMCLPLSPLFETNSLIRNISGTSRAAVRNVVERRDIEKFTLRLMSSVGMLKCHRSSETLFSHDFLAGSRSSLAFAIINISVSHERSPRYKFEVYVQTWQ